MERGWRGVEELVEYREEEKEESGDKGKRAGAVGLGQSKGKVKRGEWMERYGPRKLIGKRMWWKKGKGKRMGWKEGKVKVVSVVEDGMVEDSNGSLWWR